MKKIYSLLVCLVIAASCMAQPFTTPRYATTASGDNTFRNFDNFLKLVADTAGSTTDTINLLTLGYNNDIKVTLTDSVALRLKNIHNAHFGDYMNIWITNKTGNNHVVYFVGSNWVMDTTGTVQGIKTSGARILPVSAKKAWLQFRFDGTAWFEVKRFIQ